MFFLRKTKKTTTLVATENIVLLARQSNLLEICVREKYIYHSVCLCACVCVGSDEVCRQKT